MRVSIRGVQLQRIAVAGLRFEIPSEVMENVAEIEVGLEYGDVRKRDRVPHLRVQGWLPPRWVTTTTSPARSVDSVGL